MGVAARLLAILLLVVAEAHAQITIDAPPALAPAADRLRDAELDRLDEALRRAGLALPAPIHVTLIANDDPRAAEVPRWIVGLAFGTRDIVIFPQRVVSYPYDSLESVLRHEIAHLALTAQARSNAFPRWFHEGVATSIDAGWSLGAQVRLLAALVDDSGTARLGRLFSSDSESGAREAYLLSAVLVDDLRSRHGDDLPGRIARRMAAGRTFDEAFREVTGETADAAAARAWASYRRWTSWLPAMTSASAIWALILVIAFAAYATTMRRRFRRRRQWDEEDLASPFE